MQTAALGPMFLLEILPHVTGIVRTAVTVEDMFHCFQRLSLTLLGRTGATFGRQVGLGRTLISVFEMSR